MCVYEAGDVLLYTKAGFHSPEVWVLTTDNKHGKAVVLKGRFHEETPMGRELDIGHSNRDQVGREVVPPEEWPDDISVAVARYQLTGAIE